MGKRASRASRDRSNGGPRWAPDAAWDRLANSPTEGTSGVYHPLLGRCPVAHIPAGSVPGGGKIDYWGILSYEEVAKAATDFGTFSSVTPEDGPRILPLQSDPPEHGHYRRGLNRYFQHGAVV